MSTKMSQGISSSLLRGIKFLAILTVVGLVSVSGTAVATAVTPPDTQPPSVKSESVTPTTVVLDSGAAEVDIRLEITDESGVRPPVIVLSHRSTGQSQGFGELRLLEGNAKKGTWGKTITLDRKKALGNWSVSLYPIDDLLGNSTWGFRDIAQVYVYASEIRSVARPEICGTAEVGRTISACESAWSPSGNISEEYQWQRDGENIDGAISKSYTLKAGDLAADVTVAVTAQWSKAGEAYYYAPAGEMSLPVKPVAGSFLSTTTTIDGDAVVDGKLTANLTAWNPAPQSVKYIWTRNGEPITTATSRTYVPVKTDAGAAISVMVVGEHAGYLEGTGQASSVVIKSTPVTPTPNPEKPKPTPPTKPKPEPPTTPVTFIDIPKNHKFGKEITWMAVSGISTGVTTSKGKAYQPKDYVTREAMAAFLYRLNTPKGSTAPVGYTIPKTSPFVDVSTGHKFYKEIAWMYSSGLSTGNKQQSGKPAYAPRESVSREAMAAFMFRMMEKPGYRAGSKSPFADIKTSHKFYTQIEWMGKKGLSTGVRQPNGALYYQDKDGVSREAMAAFLYRSQR